MRNFKIAPINLGEACEALQNAQLIYISKKFGTNTDGVALLYIEMFLRQHKQLFEEFVKKETEKL